jgi:hypothetical protein
MNDNEGCERMMLAANKHIQRNDYMTKKVQLKFALSFPFASCNVSRSTFRPCGRWKLKGVQWQKKQHVYVVARR